MSGTIPPTTKFDNTLGAVLIGGLFAMALWGTSCSQTYTYFTNSFKDPRYMKLMVAFLWFLDTFDAALNIHMLYYYMVINYANPLALLTPIWSATLHVAMTTINNFIIRTMFIEKVFFLSNRNIGLTAWLMAASFTDLVVGIVSTVKGFGKTFPELRTLSVYLYLSFSLGIGSDLSLAIAMCLFLRRSRTGFRETDAMISVLVMYALNTGLIVAIDALLVMILYIVMPDNFIYIGFYLSLSKLYLNAYLATLNARAKLRSRMDMGSIHLSQISECRYAAEDSPRTVDKECNDSLQADSRGMSGTTSTGHLRDETVDGLGSSSTIVCHHGSRCMA